MTPMDSIKYYKHFLRAGFMSMNPFNGHVKAYVGGPNYTYFQYDMAMVGRRRWVLRSSRISTHMPWKTVSHPATKPVMWNRPYWMKTVFPGRRATVPRNVTARTRHTEMGIG
ncbi:hypothetical protein NXX53_16995 [Bacteroides salyersiae]|nr:hypothetical protein [Bacteroides salyersiae]